MPEAVTTWFELNNESILARVEAIENIHANLVSSYLRHLGKYSGKVEAELIESVFRNILSQLASVIDESVKRFKFKDVH